MTTDFVHNKVGDSTASGLEPVLIGFKVRLWNEKGWIPDASFTTQLRFPNLASKDLQTEHLAPRLLLHFKHSVTEKFNLGYNIGTEWDGFIPEPTFMYMLSPKFKLSDKFECYIEAFGRLPQHAKAEHWTDVGLMYLVTKNIQLELSGGYELTSQNSYHRYYQLLGLAFRI